MSTLEQLINPPKTKSDKLTWFLRDRRKECGLGLRRFAADVGMTPTEYSKLERGELSPNFEEMANIAERLDTDFAKLSAAFIAREFGEDIEI
jgi:transcriptional regulator with XRE-family HTH domain